MTAARKWPEIAREKRRHAVDPQLDPPLTDEEFAAFHEWLATKPTAQELAYLESNKGNYVYFARSGDRIKIGFTTNWPGRLRVLRTGAPELITQFIVIVGGLPREQELHAKFAHLRVNGEWFAAAPELDDFLHAIPAWERVR